MIRAWKIKPNTKQSMFELRRLRSRCSEYEYLWFRLTSRSFQMSAELIFERKTSLHNTVWHRIGQLDNRR